MAAPMTAQEELQQEVHDVRRCVAQQRVEVEEAHGALHVQLRDVRSRTDEVQLQTMSSRTTVISHISKSLHIFSHIPTYIHIFSTYLY